MTKIEISRHWMTYQALLFPQLEQALESITDNHRKIIILLDIIPLSKVIFSGRNLTGRPPKDRLAIARSFVAKAVLNLPSTEALLDRLRVDPVLRRICQWDCIRDVPCAATFSNAFAEFSDIGLLSEIHTQLVTEAYKDILIGHIARDATAIEAREKPARIVEAETAEPKRRGRPKKGEEKPAEPKRIEKQMYLPLSDMLKDLPMQCDRGAKTNAKGYKTAWNGYKMHLDVSEHGVPVSCLLTSASLHDSQVAIPLETMTSSRVNHLYSLMDKAYSSDTISFFIESQGRVAIIDPKKPRGGEAIPLDPAKADRYKIRTVAERANSELKDNAGGRHLRVRGPLKVMTHLMFGVLVITAEQLLRHVL